MLFPIQIARFTNLSDFLLKNDYLYDIYCYSAFSLFLKTDPSIIWVLEIKMYDIFLC